MVLRGRGRLADGASHADVGEVASNLVELVPLFLLLLIEELHIGFKSFLLLSHVFDMLTFFLKLVGVRREQGG